MRPKGLIRLLLTGCLLLLLSGCTFGATVDALLTPPHLRGEQEQIYQALENAVGNRITLQYPRSGNHLSAVMISDLDGDGQDEAAVFYRKESSLSTENALRLNLFDLHSTKHDHPLKNASALPAALTQPAAVEDKERTIKEDMTMKKTLHVEGMMCGHCEARVKKALEALPEVTEAVVSHEAGTAVVTLSAEVSADVLKKTVEDQDYEVTGIQ